MIMYYVYCILYAIELYVLALIYALLLELYECRFLRLGSVLNGFFDLFFGIPPIRFNNQHFMACKKNILA